MLSLKDIVNGDGPRDECTATQECLNSKLLILSVLSIVKGLITDSGITLIYFKKHIYKIIILKLNSTVELFYMKKNCRKKC